MKNSMRLSRIKLLTAIAAAGMTQTSLAESSGVSRSTISQIACGKTCAPEIAKRLSKSLDTSVGDLLEDEQQEYH